MTDFLKIDLEDTTQQAAVRLQDRTDHEDTTITEARFDSYKTRILRFGTEGKPKSFQLSHGEMDALCDAWMDYRGRIIAHEAEQEAKKEAAIAEAKKLAASVHFDLEGLNIQLEKDGDLWTITIPALGFERHTYDNNLLEIVQEFFNTRRDRIAYAIKNGWCGEWTAMVESYNRAMQGEPAEITEARKLLKEIMYPADWINASIYRTPNQQSCPGCWTFNDNEDILFVLPPAELLASIHTWLQSAYAPRYAAYMARIEPEEIVEARRLLTEANIQNWEIRANNDGTWDFTGPFGSEGETLFSCEDPDQLLVDIQAYIERKESDKELDRMDREAGIF